MDNRLTSLLEKAATWQSNSQISSGRVDVHEKYWLSWCDEMSELSKAVENNLYVQR
jgi:hypothetical protein